METINGEWIMKGLDLDDPAAIHTVEECRSLIHTLGFLPLFSNAITGFSVEEHVPSVQWWTDDFSQIHGFGDRFWQRTKPSRTGNFSAGLLVLYQKTSSQHLLITAETDTILMHSSRMS